MGFDPRRCSSAAEPHRRHTVTSNVDALLAENDSLRRQVLQLKKQLHLLRQRQWTQSQPNQGQRSDARQQQHGETTPSVCLDQVEHWGEVLAQQKGWNTLRLNELDYLIDALNRASFHPHLDLQQRLDRLMPGLGADLMAATLKPVTKKRCAVLAAFALYGIRSREWLDEDPERVVFELNKRQKSSRYSRRTRSDQRASDRNSQSYVRENKSSDFFIKEALSVLGLKRGASQDSIKKTYRRLVKQYHPDLGGSADEFRKVYEAYQQLIVND